MLSDLGAVELINAFTRKEGDSRIIKSAEEFAELVGSRVFIEWCLETERKRNLEPYDEEADLSGNYHGAGFLEWVAFETHLYLEAKGYRYTGMGYFSREGTCMPVQEYSEARNKILDVLVDKAIYPFYLRQWNPHDWDDCLRQTLWEKALEDD